MNRSSLQTRFILRVLLPPFLVLIIISVAGYLLLSSAIRKTESDAMQRVAATTAAKLDREVALRRSVLRSTGGELFSIKSDYRDKRLKLDSDYKACGDFVKKDQHFLAAPGDACHSFLASFAIAQQNNTSLQKAVDSGYTDQVKVLADVEQSAVNERLRAFIDYFPETSELIVTDKNHGIISRAGVNGQVSKEFDKTIETIAKKATDKPIEGTYATSGKNRQMIFAYPIDKGAVLASYNLDHAGFLYPSWKSAPIDNTKAYLVVADPKSQTSYPNIQDRSLYQPALQGKSNSGQISFASTKIEYLAAYEPVGQTGWRVIVSSPAPVALEALVNTQILTVAVAGILLITFLWVGSFFVRRTVDSILSLVGGALLFSSGQLTYRIDSARMSDKEFAQLADVMNHMAEKIQEAEAAIDQKNKEFISVATHEIKAPMTAIIGSLSMILDDGMGTLDEMARKLADQAYKGTIRLRDLVNELLDIARLESGRAKFNIEQIDLVKEIVDMIELQKTPADEKGITVNYQAPAQPQSVLADKTKLEIILTNFISNGIKYNRPSGSVTVSHTTTDGFVELTVQDTGLGIPKEQQASMFQKFFRVEGSDRSSIPGTGLGMYITKQFIEGMGGKLWFESEHGKGTAFHFTLPLVSTDSTKKEAPVTTQTPSENEKTN